MIEAAIEYALADVVRSDPDLGRVAEQGRQRLRRTACDDWFISEEPATVPDLGIDSGPFSSHIGIVFILAVETHQEYDRRNKARRKK